MFGLSPTEILVVGVVAVLLFGSRLPSVARSFGKSMTEFRRGMNDLQSEFNEAMREGEAAVATAAEGAQARLPRPADDADDPLHDRAYEDLADDGPVVDEPSDHREPASPADA